MVDLTDVDKARAGLIRSQRHSGCLKCLPIITGLTSNLNAVKIPADTYPINGYEIAMPETIVVLPDPPTTGARENLIFLETYFPSTGNGYTMAGRYRTVAGVDFSKYSPDGFASNVATFDTPHINFSIGTQGGNISPIAVAGDPWKTFRWANNSEPSVAGWRFSDDVGLYVSGKGDAAYKTALQTYDGYSYVVRVARVPRRNSGGFSVSNFNGARNYKLMPINIVTVAAGFTSQWTFANTADYDTVSVGDT